MIKWLEGKKMIGIGGPLGLKGMKGIEGIGPEIGIEAIETEQSVKIEKEEKTEREGKEETSAMKGIEEKGTETNATENTTGPEKTATGKSETPVTEGTERKNDLNIGPDQWNGADQTDRLQEGLTVERKGTLETSINVTELQSQKSGENLQGLKRMKTEGQLNRD